MDLYNLKLGENTFCNNNSCYTRVPGGWVYGDFSGCCFVPYSDEFKPPSPACLKEERDGWSERKCE